MTINERISITLHIAEILVRQHFPQNKYKHTLTFYFVWLMGIVAVLWAIVITLMLKMLPTLQHAHDWSFFLHLDSGLSL